ncbi:MAG: DUF4160 domain-containing protein, partial [Rhodanobacter sp.]
MPIISSFFGIYIRMYFADHAPPHIHVDYQKEKRCQGQFSSNNRHVQIVPDTILPILLSRLTSFVPVWISKQGSKTGVTISPPESIGTHLLFPGAAEAYVPVLSLTTSRCVSGGAKIA